MDGREKKRIVIAGATGFIGRNLCRLLSDKGYRIIGLTRNLQKAGEAEIPAEFISWKGKSSGQWVPFLENAWAVINLAGHNISESRWSRKTKRLILESRINAGASLSSAVHRLKIKPRMLIQVSAVGYYTRNSHEVLTEASPSGDGFLAHVCREWEASAQAFAELGIRSLILRLGIVLDREGGALPRMILPFRLKMGGLPGPSARWISWIHIHDLLRGFLFLIEKESLDGIFNFTAPYPASAKEFCRAVGKSMETPCRAMIPPGLMRIVFGEMADEVLLSSQHVVPERLERAGFPFMYPNLNAAVSDLLAVSR